MWTGGRGSAPGRVLLRDATQQRWLEFKRPRQFLQARTPTAVVAALGAVEKAVAGAGLHAAGFVSYEAAPAFDSALAVVGGSDFPLLWFGLYEEIQEAEPPLAPTRGFEELQWQPSVEREEFRQKVERIKALIRSGDTYQVNYTYRLNARLPCEPWDFFLRMMAAQDAPYGAFLDTGEWVVCSASPELFFQLDGTRIECRPMKGTAARGRTQAEDLAQATTLQASEKERAENVMIVDMVRHDLGRVARTGSVKVSRLCEVERYPTLWQMTSTVEAQTEAGLLDIFQALFPPASITGAPKVRTTQIIAELEPLPRRLYTGAIGFFAPGRRAQFNVAIRTLLANRQTGLAEYGVGSGITWDSDPEAEWQECRVKAKVLSTPTPTFSLFETMLWTPGQGFFLLERHLDRLQDSARYFGFHLDLAAVRLALKQLATNLGGTPHKVRLTVDKERRHKLESDPLPEPAAQPQRIALAHTPVDSADLFLYHKTTNRHVYESARLGCPGYEDVVLFNERGQVTESTIANVAVEIDGKLCTPPVSCGLLPGTLRAHLLEAGGLVERPITIEELLHSPRVFLLNSVRGMYAVKVARDKQP